MLTTKQTMVIHVEWLTMLTTKQTMVIHVEVANNVNNQTNHGGTCRDG